MKYLRSAANEVKRLEEVHGRLQLQEEGCVKTEGNFGAGYAALIISLARLFALFNPVMYA